MQLPFASPLAMKRPKIIKKQILGVVDECFDEKDKNNGKQDNDIIIKNKNVNIESKENSRNYDSNQINDIHNNNIKDVVTNNVNINNNDNNSNNNSNNNNNNNNNNDNNNNNNNNNIKNKNKNIKKSNSFSNGGKVLKCRFSAMSVEIFCLNGTKKVGVRKNVKKHR